jgi:hypothetical protein
MGSGQQRQQQRHGSVSNRQQRQRQHGQRQQQRVGCVTAAVGWRSIMTEKERIFSSLAYGSAPAHGGNQGTNRPRNTRSQIFSSKITPDKDVPPDKQA